MGAEHPKITVLVPTFNRSDFIAECLDSLLAQSLPASQLLIINDGSNDRTLQVLEPYRDRIVYLETPQLGKPGALNRGLEKATGEYVWIFDDDDVALPDALERLVTPLEAHQEHGFSYSPFYFTSTQKDSHHIGRVLSELTIPDLETRGFLVPLLENNFLGGAALFARRSCYNAVGGFDPALVRSQDYEMAIRLARRFTGVRAPGGPTFHYRQHSGQRGSNHDRFAAHLQMKKWWEYDSIFFRRFYRELPLTEYLRPGSSLNSERRRALLQRMGVMSGKLLLDEALQDLGELARLEDTSPFSEEERSIVRSMIRTNYRRTWNLFSNRAFPGEIRRLSASSKTVALLRKELLGAIAHHCREKPGLKRILRGGLQALFLLR